MMATQTARCESVPFYLSSIYLQTPSKSMAPSPLSSHRRLLGLVGTWQMGTIGKRTPRSQLLALSDFTACKLVLKKIVRIPYFCSYLALQLGWTGHHNYVTESQLLFSILIQKHFPTPSRHFSGCHTRRDLFILKQESTINNFNNSRLPKKKNKLRS